MGVFKFEMRWVATSTLALGLGVGVLLLNSCATQRRAFVSLHIEGAEYVGNKACADCHGNITRVFPASPHARLHVENPAQAGQSGCESCHGPGSKHIAMGGRGGVETFIINPGRNPDACFQCHLEIRASFHLPQHHPLPEGKMNCVQCHDPHGRDIMKQNDGLAFRRLNDTCAQCHREQAQPFVFQHPALREGCTSCHNPHGSINPKLLNVRDGNLCIRCHAQKPATFPTTTGTGAPTIFFGNKDHTTFVRYGACWSAGCHAAIHGSNTQPYFLY